MQNQMIEHVLSLSAFSMTTQKAISGRPVSVVHGMYIFYCIWLLFKLLHTDVWNILCSLVPDRSLQRSALTHQSSNTGSWQRIAAFVEDEDEDKDDGQDGDAEFKDEEDEGPNDAEYEVEIDDGIEFDPGDTLGKLLACITQVQVHWYSHWQYSDSINWL